MSTHVSALTRLVETIDSVAADLAALLRSIPIHRNDNHGGRFLIIGRPDFGWGQLTPVQQHEQMQLLRRYRQVSEVISVWLTNTPMSLLQQFENAHKQMLMWLELTSNFSIDTDGAQNNVKLMQAAAELHGVLQVLSHGTQNQILLIPDTNSLLSHPDPAAYRALFAQQTFEFLLLPTVLSELDELKILHRNPDVREKAEKMIVRIKGWRKQGPLLEGVTVHKTILIRAVHQEPNVSRSLSWLDAQSKDDRIVASTLELQSRYPSARIILVTGDINLQNKCDAAFIETAEL